MIAVVSDGALEVIHGGVTRTVPAQGSPSAPAFSADGAWVAFLTTPIPPASKPYAAEPSQLWVARADGSDVHALSGSAVDVTRFAWDPAVASERLAYSTSDGAGGSGQIALASPTSAHPTVAFSHGDATFAWSPSGTTLAIGLGMQQAKGNGPVLGELDLLRLDGTKIRAVLTLPGAPVEVATWWPNGKGVVFWADLGGSASLAADGLPLMSVDLATDATRTLATTLVHPEWLAWSASGSTLAVVAGPGRSVWDPARHVHLCTVPAETCETVEQPVGTVSLDPAWMPDGTLRFVRAPAGAEGPPPGLGPTGRDGPYAAAAIAAWDDTQTMWASTSAGGAPARLSEAGTGAHTPTAIADGMLYVRHDQLWYLPDTGNAVDITGPVGTPNPNDPDYYGYIPWDQDVAWHS